MTMDFYLYDEAGQIVMTGSCPADMLHLQKQPGLQLVIGKADYKTQFVSGGQLRSMPPRPGPHHSFCHKRKDWVLDDAKAWAAVRLERDRLLASTDWRLLRAAETGVPVEPEWLAYRQALRDVTTQVYALSIQWPARPDRLEG